MLVWDDKPDELDRVLVAQADKTVLDAKHGHVPLIDAKYRGNTALGLAVQLGRRECIEVLLRHQADTLLASDSGYYPLQEAASFGDRDIIQSLLLRRHDQMRQLWKVRQPFLANALHSVSISPNGSLSLIRMCRTCPTFFWKWIGTLKVGSRFWHAGVPVIDVESGNEATGCGSTPPWWGWSWRSVAGRVGIFHIFFTSATRTVECTFLTMTTMLWRRWTRCETLLRTKLKRTSARD